MGRKFNTEGQCDPKIHYMVSLDKRVQEIKERYVDQGSYFIINKGRQYGKTTTLWALEEYLKDDYLVVSMDFQGITTAEYGDEATFAAAFMRLYIEAMEESKATLEETKPLIELLKNTDQDSLSGMFGVISKMCKMADKPVVLMIDEVDSASNNQVFIDFLTLLRHYYIKRRKKQIFHSVILAGVYDIKNLKLKIRQEQEHHYNSPWNIAAVFDIEMNFSARQIADMLNEYEDKHTGMNVKEVSEEIYQYTSGYPYLVSAVCKILDEKLPHSGILAECLSVWTREGISESVKIILKSNIPLFDSLIKQLDFYKDLRNMIEDILFQGKQIPFSAAEKSINLGCMFGFLQEENGQVIVANRIFEMYLLNLFMAEEALESDAFEKYGRKFFLLYLKPIINGTGNYYLEAQTRDERRTDVIVDYLGEQFIVELKIWRGNEYNERGEAQIMDYLEYYHKDKGYMLSFNFNKRKEVGVREIRIGSKTIVEAVV